MSAAIGPPIFFTFPERPERERYDRDSLLGLRDNRSVTFTIALLCAAAGMVSGAQHQDLYPQIRSIIREAEGESVNIRAFDDRSVPAEWAGHLYARAGYLGDAEGAFSRTSRFPFAVLKGYVLYGYVTEADKVLACIADPNQKGNAQLVVADIFWRMGQSDKAEEYIERAKKTAALVKDPPHRAALLQSARQNAQYMREPAPNRLSPIPAPSVTKDPAQSPFPQFPITAEGFGDKTPEQTEQQAKSNSTLMEDLYTRLMAGDREGLQRIGETTTTPFQKTLVIASIEHLLIQAHEPEKAEQLAVTIPKANDECVLAKAEALSSAAAAWLRSGNADRANAAFGVAMELAQSAHTLPIGEVTVLASIAEAQAFGGLIATSQGTLKIAKDIASQLPLPPAFVPGTRPLGQIPHYRSEAYRQIFSVAMRAHDLGTARQIAELWNTTGRNGDYEVIQAWLQAGKAGEAIAFARGIRSTPERAKIELCIAQQMLDLAGAPNI